MSKMTKILLIIMAVSLVHKLTLPDTDIDRTFVVIKKTAATSKKYPRKAGLPAKEPLQ